MENLWKTGRYLGDAVCTNPKGFASSTGYAHSYPPVFHIPIPLNVTLRKELTTTATEIAIIIAAAANGAGVIIGLGQLKQSLSDIRDDIRAQRTELQSCLQTLLLLIKPGNPGEHR